MGDMADNFSPGGVGAREPEESSIKNLVEYKSKIVGVTFEGRQDVIAMLAGDEPLRVRREADNKFDPLAVAVDAQIAETWQPIGYIAKDKNKDIAATLDAGNEVEIGIASLTGGDKDSKGKVKSRGVNIALTYTKIDVGTKDGYEPIKEARTQSSSKLNYSQSQLDALFNDSNTLAQIKALLGITETTEKYTSRILGKSIDVTVNNGHVGLPGFMSGSKFPGQFFEEFPKDRVLEAMSKKGEVDSSIIEKMWEISGLASSSFGNAVHAAMENFDTYYRLGDKLKTVKKFKTKPDEVGPNKALSKNPFIKKIVTDFHELFGGDYTRFSEQFIWLSDKKLCGSIDRLKVIDAEKRIVRIQDFKTDGDVNEKLRQNSDSPFKDKIPSSKLGYHQLQLSFYAYILRQYGYTVEGIDIYWLNPEKLCTGENAWEEYSSEVVDLEGVL